MRWCAAVGWCAVAGGGRGQQRHEQQHGEGEDGGATDFMRDNPWRVNRMTLAQLTPAGLCQWLQAVPGARAGPARAGVLRQDVIKAIYTSICHFDRMPHSML